MTYIADAISKHGGKNKGQNAAQLVSREHANQAKYKAKAKPAVAPHVEIYFMMEFTEIVKAAQSNRVYQLSSVAGGPMRIFLTFSGNH